MAQLCWLIIPAIWRERAQNAGKDHHRC